MTDTATPERRIAEHAYALALEERYRELVKLRAWYRVEGARLGWADWASENRVAIQTVVRIRWNARKASRSAWAPGELSEAFGA